MHRLTSFFRLRKKIVFGVALTLLTICMVNCFLSVFLTIHGGPTIGDTHSYSLEESVEKGTFVRELLPRDYRFDFVGQKYMIKRCWIEQSAELTSEIVIVPYFYHIKNYNKLDHFTVVVDFEEQSLVRFGPNPLYLNTTKEYGFRFAGPFVWRSHVKASKDPEKLIIVNNLKDDLLSSRLEIPLIR